MTRSEAVEGTSPSSAAISGGGESIGILAVVVLYKLLPQESTTLRTLHAAADAVSQQTLRLKILLFDNTPGQRDKAALGLPAGVDYYAAPHNPGLAVAYNAATRAASRQGYPWLLTLDQDTTLPRNFFALLLQSIARYQAETQVAAIVPHILDRGRPLSPLVFRGGFLPAIVSPTFSGIGHSFTSALNSASLLRVEALHEIGGYDERFPLNNSDTSLFHRLGAGGKRVAVADGLTVQHELAIMDREHRMSIERYRQLLADERAFWDLEMTFLARAERLLRLLGRWAKDRARNVNQEFRAATLQEIRLRLLTRRNKRIAAWKQQFAGRATDA